GGAVLYPRARARAAAPSAPRLAGLRSPSSVVFEGERHARAKCGDLAVFQLHVHLRYFGHAQVAQRPGGSFHRAATRVLPRFVADTDDFDDLVDRIRLLLRHGILRRLDCARSRGARGDGNSIRGTYGLTPVPRRPRGANASGARPSALIRNQHWKPRKRRIVPALAWAGASHCRAFDSGSCPPPHSSKAMARAPGGTRSALKEGVCS